MKTGATYYHAFIVDEGKVGIWTYVLRTIRGRYGYLVLKDSFTWGKRSTKTGDYGWLDPVPEWCRTRFLVEDGAPPGYGLSKSAALRSALAAARKGVARAKERGDLLPEGEANVDALARRLKREGKSS